MLPTTNELEKYLGELKPCIICTSKNLESWAKLDYLEANKCKDCGMISVNPHLNEEGLERLKKIRQTEIKEYMSVERRMTSYVNTFHNNLSKKAEEILSWMKNEGLEPGDFFQGKRGVWNYFKKLTDGIFDDSIYGSYVRQTHTEEKWKSAKSTLNATQIEQLKLWLNVTEEYRNEGKQKYFTYQVLLANIYSLMVISEIEKILFTLKQEQNIVFIHEFNNMISEIVKKEPAPFVYERLGEHYSHFLVDEFQDTSELQWKNLIPLLENSLANGNFNMVVGDGKQSIYRWRGGDVEQFADLPAVKGEKDAIMLEREESLRRNYFKDVLKTNFRSRKNIIDFNNNLFQWISEKILPDSLKKVYDECKQSGKEKNAGGYVSIDFIRESAVEGEIHVCEKIIDYIRLNTNEYGFSFSDITILTRNKKNGKLAADFLLANGIPIVSNESLLLSKNESVNALVSLLYLVREDRASIHEANVLNYFSKENSFEGKDFQSILSEFQNMNCDIFDFLTNKKIFSNNRRSLNSMSLFNLCASLIHELNLDNTSPVFIQFFMDEVFKYTKTNHENLSGFLQWWEQNGHKCSAVLPEGTNAVKIMTIHAAKGLQFPVVIFAFADWELFKSDLIWINSAEDELPELNNVLVKANNKLNNTPFFSAYETERSKQLLDNVNLFYVASTRPENHLHIISRDRTKSSFVDDWLKNFTKVAPELNPFENGFELGKMGSKVSKDQSKDKTPKKVVKTAIQWKELDISNLLYLPANAKKNELIENKRIDGILFHLAMSQINQEHDIDKTKGWLIAKGHCSSEKASIIAAKIKSLFKNHSIRDLFKSDIHAINEPDILIEKSIIRPDRIIFDKEKTRIIDYKTGTERSDYHEQLYNYGNALQQCGFPNIEKLIIYVEEEKIEFIT